jgi:putative transposase
VRIEVPRDRDGSFSPRVVPKNVRRIGGFDEAIISLYAKGLTTGEIQAHLHDVYGAEVSRELVSKVTDAVNDELVAWRNRPLDRVYPVVFVDAIVVKIRDGAVANRPVYVVVGVSVDGERDVLGMWVGTGGEGAKQWLAYLTELKNRGAQDVLILCSDGLKGIGEAIEQVWPLATHQTCVVHPSCTVDVAVHEPQGLAGHHPGHAGHLHRLHSGRGGGPVRRVRRDVGRQVPGSDPGLARRLGPVHTVSGLR